MKFLLPLALFTCGALHAQYYYKDIIGTREAGALIKSYLDNNVLEVRVASYDADNTRNDAFYVAQTFSKPHARLQTTTRNGDQNESTLTTFANNEGQILKTVDSSKNLISTTQYSYDANGSLSEIISRTADSAKQIDETETHTWFYENGLPVRMLRVVNGRDTTFVSFKQENGNVVEENTLRKGVRGEPVFYYYDAAQHLTDIVGYSGKAKRLLPEYLFEYSPAGRVIQKITVPANSSDYLIWRYQYDAGGLKTKEAIYDKTKTLAGKVEYTYSKG